MLWKRWSSFKSTQVGLPLPPLSLPLGLWEVGWEGRATDMAFQRLLRTGLLGCCTAVVRIREKLASRSALSLLR